MASAMNTLMPSMTDWPQHGTTDHGPSKPSSMVQLGLWSPWQMLEDMTKRKHTPTRGSSSLKVQSLPDSI